MRGLLTTMDLLARLGLFAVLILGAPLPSLAQSPAVQRGMNLVRASCAQCHAIDKVSPSPLRAAPPFRILHLRYPVESLEEALAEGIVTGHPSKPEFRLDPGQINDVISFLKSLER
jgi:mono/diheme cytochrome c family protein